MTLRSSIASFGMQREAQLLFQCGAPRFELRPFRLGDGAHFGIGRRIGDQAGHAVKLALRGAIGFHRLDHRRQLGEFARKLHVGLGRQRSGEIAFQCRMAGDERVEFLIGKHRIIVWFTLECRGCPLGEQVVRHAQRT